MRSCRKWTAYVLSGILAAVTFTSSFASISVLGADTATVSEDKTSEQTEDSFDDSSMEKSSMEVSSPKDSSTESAAGDTSDNKDSGKVQDSGTSESVKSSEDTGSEDPGSSTEEDDPSGDAVPADYEEKANDSETGEASGFEETAGEDPDSEEADSNTKQEDPAASDTGSDSAQVGSAADTDPDSDPDAAVTDPALADTAEVQEHEPLSAASAAGEIIPSEEFDLNADNEDAFAAYVNRELDLSGDLKFDSGSFDTDADRMEKSYASSRLNSVNLKVYNILYKQICNVAAGKRSDTVFSFSVGDIGLSGRSWSASELGIKSIVVNNNITDQAMAALDRKCGLDLGTVVMALLADCPYELYWYDKEEGAEWNPFEYTAEWINGEWRLYYSGDNPFVIQFYVSADYSASGRKNTLRVNQSIGTSVARARETALSIVSRYKGCTDYEKLNAYKEEICDLTGYNDDAGSNMDAYAYGDPWQLIWVFDQDPRTEVVCEGYAKSFQYLCDLSSWHNIFRECICVTGTMSYDGDSFGHMWNIVALGNGNSYLVDITNCDDGTVGEGNGRTDLFLAGTASPSSDRVFAQGSLNKGYYFGAPVYSTYSYDRDTRRNFDDQILTLAAGRPDENTSIDFSKAVITGIKNKTYNGKAQTQDLVVVVGSLVLRSGKDYKVSYSGNTNAGTASLTIEGLGIYSGTHKKTFTISKASQTIKLSAASTIEAGKTTKVTASGAKETTKYNFASSNTSIAAVSGNGTVTGKTPGTVTITVTTAATANYTAASRSVKITVIKVLKKPGYCHFVKWNNKNYTGCRIAWNKTAGAEGYQTHLCWTDGSHASYTIVKANVLYRDCKVYANHISLMRVRAFYTLNGVRKYGPWSNIEFITPSPTKLSFKNVSTSKSNLKMKVTWDITYGCNGYNVFVTTNPNGKWYWNQSTAVKANATSAVITKCNGKLKKNTRYYVRIVSRRKFKGVFCSVPMPAKNTYAGSFVIR